MCPNSSNSLRLSCSLTKFKTKINLFSSLLGVTLQIFCTVLRPSVKIREKSTLNKLLTRDFKKILLSAPVTKLNNSLCFVDTLTRFKRDDFHARSAR